LGAYQRISAVYSTNPRAQKALDAWSSTGQAKITLKVTSEKELIELEEKARASGIITYMVRDAGHTQVAPGSCTVVALGPEESAAIDAITRHLKLL
jgi:peptidyl-tRNA hydrolase, PTH2 family